MHARARVMLQVVVDVFFRIQYFRHVLFGRFDDVAFTQAKSYSDAMRLARRGVEAGQSQMILAVLRDEAFHLLAQADPWMQRLGVLHIDDEKLEADLGFAENVAFTIRNYYHADRIAPKAANTFYVPVGWRTTGACSEDRRRAHSGAHVRARARGGGQATAMHDIASTCTRVWGLLVARPMHSPCHVPDPHTPRLIP